MITVTSLGLSIAGRALLHDASFVVARGDKAAIVGRNGAGKSSLVSVVVGEPFAQLSQTGEVHVLGTLGYLPQVPVVGGLGTDASALSHVLSSRGLDVLDVELAAARRSMAEHPTPERISVFSETEERYRALGGYEAESTLAHMAEGLGLHQDLLFEDVDSLSGGQRRRLDLMRVLFAEPDVMVLDEPTNHLDVPAKRWLMEQLAQFKGALLVVSHDLALLDRAITKVLHLGAGVLDEYAGTYTSFRAQLDQRLERQQRLAVRQAREVVRLSTLADSMRASTVKRARIAKTLDKRVERLERARIPSVKKERRVRFTLPVPPRSGDTPLEVTSLAVSYDARHVLRDVSLALARGDRAVVVGRNGAGKSSLLRCLSGVQIPSGGTVTLGHNVVIGYFAQEHEQVDPERSALGNIDDTVLRTEVERRSLLGSFGLSGELATRRAASLSGGERAKLSLAMLAAGRSNLLVLDEPTNNLDPQSVTAVGAMLATWPGTLVVVSHDRAFIEALAPTHALLLPSERFDFWRESYLDQVELR
ncbi:MAG: ABC-F family ATP-binding cassette domain-containing protein [Actinomycetota bacterium]|nr:ABC-F family ATP-binding cassette domain-containing protein [Actinomycetota bacterium]